MGVGCSMSGLRTGSHFSRVARQRYILRHCHAIERWYPQAVVSLLGKWFTGLNPGDVAWYVPMKIICPIGFKVAWGLGLGALWAILSGWSLRPKWAWISRCRTSRNCLYYFNVLYTKIKPLIYDVLLSKVVI